MRGRTFVRIMIDNLFVNNAICKALSSLVNFCNEQAFFNKGKLKFSKKMPLNIVEQESNYKTKFIFKNNHKTGVGYK